MNSETLTLTQEVAQDNVDVNTIEGLLSFREALADVHEESLVLAGDLTNEPVRVALEKAEDVYAKTLSFVDRCIDSKEQGEELSDEDIDKLQQGYNDLLDILDVLSERDSQETEESTVRTEEVVEEPVVVLESVPMGEPGEVVSIPVLSTGAEVVDAELPQKAEEALFVVALKGLRTEVEVSLVRAEDMLEKYQEITEVVATDAAINIGQHYYNQLRISTERARNTNVRLSEYIEKGNTLSELVLEHLKDTVDEIAENLDQLEKGLGQFFESDTEDEELESRVSSGSVGVGKEDEVEVTVPIVVKNKEPEPEPQKEEVPVAAAVSIAVLSKKEGEIHHAPLESSPAQKAERAPRTPLSDTVDTILEIPRYKQFAARTFHSKAHFEVTLRRQIQKIESQQTSGFFYDTFGYKYANAFETFLSGMTCAEIFEFDTKPYNFKIETLTQKNVKYETYLAWVDMMVRMFEMTSAHKDITFGELFVRSELEELIEIEAVQQEAA